MADWPRWIDQNVDSLAMLSAYLWYVTTFEPNIGPLPFIVHRTADYLYISEPPAPPGTYAVTCNDADCVRCLRGQGGYQFRWHSRHCFEKYKELARPGAWRNSEGSSPQ